MPKLQNQPTYMGWFILALVIGLLVWGIVSLSQKLPGYLSLGLVALIAYGCVAGWRHNTAYESKLKRMASNRTGESICEFARSFDTQHVDTWVIRAVYEQLQNYLAHVVPEFPVRADDYLRDHLINDPDDLDLDLVSEIAKRTNRSLLNADQNPYYDCVLTVRDLVLFFNAQPKLN